MATLSQSVGRMDILLHRGVVEKVGAQWHQRESGGTEYSPVDMSGDNAQFQMFEIDNDVLYDQKCVTTTNGCAYVIIPDSAFTNNEWEIHKSGKWHIVVTHNGKKTLLGWGNYLIV